MSVALNVESQNDGTAVIPQPKGSCEFSIIGASMLIQPKFLSLSDLLANRLFRIPQYQRSYSWERKHRDDMFEDIQALRDQPERRHFMATVVGLNRGQKTIYHR